MLIALENELLRLAAALLSADGSFDTAAGAAMWWDAAQGRTLHVLGVETSAKPRFNATLAAQLQRLRAAGIELAEAARAGEALPAEATETLNRALGQARPVARPGGIGLSVAEPMDVVLVPLAYALATLLSADTRRLKRCRFVSCGIFFWDRTKNRSRRWCSLGCMERERAPRRRLER